MWWKEAEELARERQKELREEAEEEMKLSVHDIPIITFSLALVNIAVFALFSLQSNYESIVLQWGFTPNNITQLKSLPTFITHMFLHANFWHLFLNMLIFVQFGYLCERRIGRRKFTSLYTVCGIFAVLFHTFFNIGSEIPLVGGSGAIFGVLASYALLFPERKLYLLLGHMPVKVPSLIGILFVFLLETLYVFLEMNPFIAHTAHIGGGIARVIMIAILYPKKSVGILLTLLNALIPTVSEQKERSEKASDKRACMSDLFFRKRVSIELMGF